jgi:hypothetical protein
MFYQRQPFFPGQGTTVLVANHSLQWMPTWQDADPSKSPPLEAVALDSLDLIGNGTLMLFAEHRSWDR